MHFQDKVAKALLDYQLLNDSSNLVSCYSQLIYEYADIIYYKRIDFSKKRHRYFIALFLTGKAMGETRGGIFISHNTHVAIGQVLKLLKNIFAAYTREELFNEMVIPFLIASLKYREQGIGFNSYIRSVINVHVKDCIVNDNKRDPVDYAERYDFFSYNDQFHINFDLFKGVSIEREDIETKIDVGDTRFIKGEMAGVFSELSIRDRKILVEYYIYKKSDRQIAHAIAMHPSSVQRIRKKLEDHYFDLLGSGDIKCYRPITKEA